MLRRVLRFAKRVLLTSCAGECGQASASCFMRFPDSSVRVIAHSYSANVLESVVDAVRQGWGHGLQQLDLRSNIIADRIQDLAAILRSCPSLSVLNLEHNSLGDEGMLSLAAVLPHCAALTTLFLGDNSVGKSGIALLAAALPRAPMLATLALGGNCIEDEGCRALQRNCRSARR